MDTLQSVNPLETLIRDVLNWLTAEGGADDFTDALERCEDDSERGHCVRAWWNALRDVRELVYKIERGAA